MKTNLATKKKERSRKGNTYHELQDLAKLETVPKEKMKTKLAMKKKNDQEKKNTYHKLQDPAN